MTVTPASPWSGRSGPRVPQTLQFALLPRSSFSTMPVACKPSLPGFPFHASPPFSLRQASPAPPSPIFAGCLFRSAATPPYAMPSLFTNQEPINLFIVIELLGCSDGCEKIPIPRWVWCSNTVYSPTVTVATVTDLERCRQRWWFRGKRLVDVGWKKQRF